MALTYAYTYIWYQITLIFKKKPNFAIMLIISFKISFVLCIFLKILRFNLIKLDVLLSFLFINYFLKNTVLYLKGLKKGKVKEDFQYNIRKET